MELKLLSPDKIDPPIQTENLLSGGAMTLNKINQTLIFMLDGARAVTSFYNLSAIPVYIVVPPERTIFWYKSFLTSLSAYKTD